MFSNKTLRVTHRDVVFNVYLYLDQDKAIMRYANTGSFVCEIYNVTGMNTQALNDLARKAARHVVGMNRDYVKLESLGINFKRG